MIFRLFVAILFGCLRWIYSVVCGDFIRLFVDFRQFKKDALPFPAPFALSNFLFAASYFLLAA